MMDVQLEADLVRSIELGEIDEWQAMTVQTCRDAAYARGEVEGLKKKLEALERPPEPQPVQKKVSPVRIVPRG